MKKNIPRIYISTSLKPEQILSLSKDNVHYIQKVLRMKVKNILEIFNNTNHIFLAEIIYMSHKNIKIKILEYKLKSIESPLHIHLGQVISDNEKMNFTIQKSIEMGVNIITPLFSNNCNIKRNINFSKKIKRWEKIIISACRQCHRNMIPLIQLPQDIRSWFKNTNQYDIKIVFHPESKLTINHLPPLAKNVQFIIGSEGGFSDDEILEISQYGFIPIKLGPRILRTETAAIAAIAALQIKFGDFII